MDKCPVCNCTETHDRNSSRVDFKCGYSHNLDMKKTIAACSVGPAVSVQPVVIIDDDDE